MLFNNKNYYANFLERFINSSLISLSSHKIFTGIIAIKFRKSLNKIITEKTKYINIKHITE